MACAVGKFVYCWCTCTGNLTSLSPGRDDKIGPLPEELRPADTFPDIDEWYLVSAPTESVSVSRDGYIHFRTSSQSSSSTSRYPRGHAVWLR